MYKIICLAPDSKGDFRPVSGRSLPLAATPVHAPKATVITVTSRLGWLGGRIKFDCQAICLHSATARTGSLVLH